MMKPSTAVNMTIMITIRAAATLPAISLVLPKVSLLLFRGLSSVPDWSNIESAILSVLVTGLGSVSIYIGWDGAHATGKVVGLMIGGQLVVAIV